MKRTTSFLILIITFGLSLFAGQADAAPLTGATNISARGANSCAVVAGGKVRCWGENVAGQIGDDTIGADRTTGVLVLNPAGNGPLTGATQVTVGLEFACARLGTGQVRCWGKNHAGQLGSGNTSIVPTTHSVVVRNNANTGPLTDITQLSAGSSHVCARKSNGEARCWGTSGFGQVGYGDDDARNLPTTVLNVAGTGPLTGVAQVAAGTQHSCARLTNKQVRCWGANYQGQIGTGAGPVVYLRPAAVRQSDGTGNIGNVTNISIGGLHTCVALVNTQARCWGDGGDGQLGEQHTNDRPLPVVVEAPGADLNFGGDNVTLTGVVQVSAGQSHTCFRLDSGQVRCAGSNHDGQLGDPSLPFAKSVPVLVRNAADTGPLAGVEQIVAGGEHTCARGAGVVQCWGDDSSGQLGNGNPKTDSDLPVAVQLG